MISGLVKNIIPNRVKAYIRMGNERSYFSEVISEIEACTNDFDLLIGTAIHTNLGDHLITLAEQQLFRDLVPNRKVYEIPSEAFQFYQKRLRKSVKRTTRIFINGGGWMGNLWPNEEKLLQNMVDTFYQNKIVIFPQTVFYDGEVSQYQELLDGGNRIYRKCVDLTLFVRDKQSFDFAKRYINIKKIALVPDIALYYTHYYTHKCSARKEKTIGVCVREDREKSSDSREIEYICEALSAKGFQIERISTMNEKRVPSKVRQEVCEDRLNAFSKYSAIITDRLHGMIFSYLVGTPCIAFDNRTRKVSGVYEQWLSDCKTIFPGFAYHDAQRAVAFVQEHIINDGVILDLEKSFEPIKQEVRYGGNKTPYTGVNTKPKMQFKM